MAAPVGADDGRRTDGPLDRWHVSAGSGQLRPHRPNALWGTRAVARARRQSAAVEHAPPPHLLAASQRLAVRYRNHRRSRPRAVGSRLNGRCSSRKAVHVAVRGDQLQLAFLTRLTVAVLHAEDALKTLAVDVLHDVLVVDLARRRLVAAGVVADL